VGVQGNRYTEGDHEQPRVHGWLPPAMGVIESFELGKKELLFKKINPKKD
jgi:hypothetical protein